MSKQNKNKMNRTSLFALLQLFFICVIPMVLTLEDLNDPELRSELDLMNSKPKDPQPTRLALSCFANIPEILRDSCRQEASETYRKTLYTNKKQCCTRWKQIKCLQKYVYNAIYCNAHQQQDVTKYFSDIYQFFLQKNIGECYNYPPIELDKPKLWKRVGEKPRCVPIGEL